MTSVLQQHNLPHCVTVAKGNTSESCEGKLIIQQLIGLLVSVTPIHFEPIATCPPYARLIEVLSETGIAYQYKAEVISLSVNGTQTSRISIGPDLWALYSSKADGIVSIRPSELVSTSAVGKSHPILSIGYQVFAVGDTIFNVGRNVTLLKDELSFPIQGTNRYAGVAINSKSNGLVVFALPMTAPLLTYYHKVNEKWTYPAEVRTPEIEDVGFCTLLPGRNDIRFLNDDVITYIGAFSALDRKFDTTYPKLIQAVNDLSRFPLNDPSFPNEGTCFLFVTRMSDGLTQAVARFAYHSSSELGGGANGGMTVSADRNTLYIRTYDRILKVQTKELLNSVGVSTID